MFSFSGILFIWVNCDELYHQTLPVTTFSLSSEPERQLGASRLRHAAGLLPDWQEAAAFQEAAAPAAPLPVTGMTILRFFKNNACNFRLYTVYYHKWNEVPDK